MIKIHSKTLTDLEYPTVLAQISEFCTTALGKEKALNFTPYTSANAVKFGLRQTKEYTDSFMQDKRIPNHGFDDVSHEIKLLNIEDSQLEVGGIRRIGALQVTVNDHLSFFKKQHELYPTLHRTVQKVVFSKEITEAVDRVIDHFGEIKDDASPLLEQTRRSINRVKGKINSSFGKALTTYNGYGYLDEIRESVVDNVRVLAVSSMHRRKVKGSIMGSSKTGSIVYIQPETTAQSYRELNNLLFEESEEIKRILFMLTETIRPYRELLVEYQQLLSDIDMIAAKTKYAQQYDGVLPKIVEEKELELKDAYHPLLLLNNKAKDEKTYPQDIRLSQEGRIIVISGPNAGGKSITLKTIGLLQIMLQSGILLPVHEYTRMSLFELILTDIGDNQSIENQLSTYSYRLKNMNYFLRKCNENTLFLIDEFGTGTDPELGGALAEVFLEVFHERESFGVITTHYANLKAMAASTPEIVNANMMFDAKTLQPLFKLHYGEAGSSFTFEVAQKNGIPYSLINRAKKKVERGKIRFDKSIANLQKERSKLTKKVSSIQKKEQELEKKVDQFDETNAKIQRKLENYQELYDTNQRLIYLGQKLDTLSDRYAQNKKKRPLMDELFKIVQVENAKRKKQNVKEKKKEDAHKKQVANEAKQKIEKIRVKKKAAKKTEETKEAAKPKPVLELGDKVRMFDGKAVGSIDDIEKGKATVNYGIFTTNVSLDLLELVERKKG
ncbi:DNA mismatch repair protein MutS [Gangjinia marincola]|uniref:DNA mismatch repair protein MutS n=1 Tax=Gangjinia marincola TaxID=578463 RepID=A0ABP3XUK0_9FLAO